MLCDTGLQPHNVNLSFTFHPVFQFQTMHDMSIKKSKFARTFHATLHHIALCRLFLAGQSVAQ